NLENCMNSIDKFGMSMDTISSRLVHLDGYPTFKKAVYHFASPKVSEKLIQEYETRTKSSIRNLIMSSNTFPDVNLK
ncbi:7722_t:CDS:1, partial [Ambispora leptoticha]